MFTAEISSTSIRQVSLLLCARPAEPSVAILLSTFLPFGNCFCLVLWWHVSCSASLRLAARYTSSVQVAEATAACDACFKSQHWRLPLHRHQSAAEACRRTGTISTLRKRGAWPASRIMFRTIFLHYTFLKRVTRLRLACCDVQ